MKPAALLGIGLLALGGCTHQPPPLPPHQHTLAADARFPRGEMARFFSPEKWSRLREIEYAGYVIMEAQIRPDGSVVLGRETESYPDASWNLLARALGQQARLLPAMGASHLDPKAEIYVVFFPSGWDGNLALIFGRQAGDPGGPRATCLATTRY